MVPVQRVHGVTVGSSRVNLTSLCAESGLASLTGTGSAPGIVMGE